MRRPPTTATTHLRACRAHRNPTTHAPGTMDPCSRPSRPPDAGWCSRSWCWSSWPWWSRSRSWPCVRCGARPWPTRRDRVRWCWFPGTAATVSDLDPLVAEVRREGRTAVVFRPSGDGTGDLRTQAKRLADLVERTLREQRRVRRSTWSATRPGGVIARLYVRDEGGASVVRRVLTIGSPQHGTDVAQLAQDAVGSCPTACEQLATDSELVRQLNAGDETPDGPRWVTVRSTSDRIVVADGHRRARRRGQPRGAGAVPRGAHQPR